MQQLNPSEISEIIKSRIAKLDTSTEARNEGTVVSVSDGIVRIHGLADVMFGEQHRELSQALVEAERRVLEALQADQEFETGKGSPHRALQIAMLKKREAEIGAYGDPAPDDEEDADDAPSVTATGEDRIVAGLKARRAPAREPTE